MGIGIDDRNEREPKHDCLNISNKIKDTNMIFYMSSPVHITSVLLHVDI